MAHKHANAMLEYAMDALQTDAPWQRWEYRKLKESCWRQPGSHPCWFEDCEYRRKPSQDQLDIEAFNVWWIQHGEKVSPSDVWTAALKWERSRNGQ